MNRKLMRVAVAAVALLACFVALPSNQEAAYAGTGGGCATRTYVVAKLESCISWSALYEARVDGYITLYAKYSDCTITLGDSWTGWHTVNGCGTMVRNWRYHLGPYYVDCSPYNGCHAGIAGALRHRNNGSLYDAYSPRAWY